MSLICDLVGFCGLAERPYCLEIPLVYCDVFGHASELGTATLAFTLPWSIWVRMMTPSPS
ncbi:MAG: hypothetical protein LZF86_80156 [Nitrospira sp.]|nr:MAG: hypothetical protein LZF86_80156 [Nitrospira sp.]